MGFLDFVHPGWRNSDRVVRLKAVEKLTDQATLVRVAKRDDCVSIRLAAIRLLTDQAVLTNIANSDKDEGVRGAAVKKLTDEKLLTAITRANDSAYARKIAVNKLTCEPVLIEAAKTDRHRDVRITAVEKLVDQTALAWIATNDRNADIREAAVKRIVDQTFLHSVAKNDKVSSVREAATARLTDRTVLAEFTLLKANADALSHTRWESVESLTDQAVLCRIAKTDCDAIVRDGAVRRLYNLLSTQLRTSTSQFLTNRDIDQINGVCIPLFQSFGIDGNVLPYGCPDVRCRNREPLLPQHDRINEFYCTICNNLWKAHIGVVYTRELSFSTDRIQRGDSFYIRRCKCCGVDRSEYSYLWETSYDAEAGSKYKGIGWCFSCNPDRPMSFPTTVNTG
jgi:hypothetical protein